MAADKDGLKEVSNAVRQRVLEPEHIRLLSDWVAEIRVVARRTGRLRAATRDLERALGPLTELSKDVDGPIDPAVLERLTEKSVTRLDDRMRKPLDRISAPRTRAAISDVAPTPPDPAFACMSQYEACVRRTKSPASRFWCNVAMIVCLVRTVLPYLTTAERRTP
jgi:hypothetical protein